MNTNFNNKTLYKYVIFFLILYTSLIIGFIYDENSTGGALIDYSNQKKISEYFSVNFKETFLNYDQYNTRHSPLLIIFLSFFEKVRISDYFIRLIHLHLCLFLPVIFFNILKIKFKLVPLKNLLFLVGLFFLSPTFRSLSIWPDSRLMGLIFFCISIFFYYKFQDTKKFNYVLLNVFFCALSAYISPNFCVFSLFYLYQFFLFYKSSYKKILIIIFFNIILSLPIFYYLIVLEINFLNKSAATNLNENTNNILFTNLFNNLLLSVSIIFFYLIPFIYTKIITIKKFFDYQNILISILI